MLKSKMRFLIVISVTVAVAFSAPDDAEESARRARQFGAYSFSYTGDNLAKSEVREPDGTIRGAYTFVDEFGHTNQIQYVAGANRGFEVVSHKVQENGQLVEQQRGETPEVIAARESHLRYQAQVKAALPTLQEDRPHHFPVHQPQHTFHPEHTFAPDGPLVYRRIQAPAVEPPPVPVLEVVQPQHLVITHVPSPVRHPPVVSIVDVIPPQKIAKTLAHNQQPFPPVFVFEEEVRQPVHPEHIQHLSSVVAPPVPEAQPVQVHSNGFQPDPSHFVHTHSNGFQPDPSHFVHSNGFQPEHRQFVHPHSNGFQPEQLAQVRQSFPQAHDVQLVDGFTPEVAAARDQHLATFAQIKASLPLTDD